MNAVGAFLLGLAALIGTWMFFNNPLDGLLNYVHGKSESEVREDLDSLEGSQWLGIFGRGCGTALYIIFALVFIYIVKPLAIIAALVYEIGNQTLAYTMLVIVGLSIVLPFVQARMGRSKTEPVEPKVTVRDEQGREIEGAIVETDKVFDVSSYRTPWVRARRLLYSLPTFYLWYMFLVVIGVV